MMNSTSRSALNAYSQVDVETNISSASPHKLISMLFNGALQSIAHARAYLQQGDMAAKGAAISKAISIIDDGLSASVDEKSGGEIAKDLKSLYEYMTYRLLIANLKKDVAALDEVSRLLSELKGAWDSIENNSKSVAPSPTPATQPIPQRSSISYGKV